MKKVAKTKYQNVNKKKRKKKKKKSFGQRSLCKVFRILLKFRRDFVDFNSKINVKIELPVKKSEKSKEKKKNRSEHKR